MKASQKMLEAAVELNTDLRRVWGHPYDCYHILQTAMRLAQQHCQEYYSVEKQKREIEANRGLQSMPTQDEPEV
jgi:hypothetical protein